MDAKKKNLLETTYENFLESTVKNGPLEDLAQWVNDAVMGYGTTLDEKMASFDEYKEMMVRQKEQSAGMEMGVVAKSVIRKIFKDENAALFVDELEITFFIGEDKHELFIRLSTVLEYAHGQWKVVHFHASKPDSTDGEKDTWYISEWERKNAELERLVAEKTADLVLKNRELEIEAVLERVRSRTMAMHKTDELRSVIHTVFEQLKILGFDATACGLTLFNKEDKSMVLWLAGFETDSYPESYYVPYFDHPMYNAQFEAWEKGQTYQLFKFEGELKRSYDELIFELGDFKNLPSSAAEAILSIENATNGSAFMKYGMLESIMIGDEVLSEHQADTLQRFAKVFEQTYTRFLDLQKAEAQAREAQIEAALERVRSRTMAMHKSEELSELVMLMYKEIEPFGVSTLGISIAIFREEENAIEYWFADHLDSNLLQSYKVAGQKNKVFGQIWEVWKNKIPQTQVYMEGQEKWDYDSFILEETEFSKLPEELKWDIRTHKTVCFTFTIFKYGYLESIDLTIPKEENADVLIRFAKVFEQAYTRFLDLQKAEAQAREAQIEAALERVRSRATAMRHSDELSEAAELLYNEFLKLGVESFSCGYLINDDEKAEWKIWLTNPGEPFFKEYWTAPYKADHNLKARYKSWKRQEEFHCTVLEGEENRAHHIVISKYAPWKTEMLESLPQRLVFNSAHFSLGHLLVISPDRLGDELEQAMVRFAGVFDLAYRRFLDLQIAEEQAAMIKQEKERLEKVLKHLQATQAQLVQSEKLASLGELTAGIAHEIQNPLNFVNNFAELSVDLAEELKEEMEKDPIDKEFMKELMDDLTSNQQKINHHGKRAASIVTGMLQHARTSTGTKEPTDLNALADEYLRLSYHGLRAKDSTFNAKMITDLDPSIGKVEVIPQDIGRVFLNIINNAFYAVQQRAGASDGVTSSHPVTSPYEPTVSIFSKKENGQVVFKIKDNGTGIPDDVKAKIFQPFFTTKPTGQGTGLGLSLSYDIVVKGHGGNLSVETEAGKGTTFIIHLPITTKPA